MQVTRASAGAAQQHRSIAARRRQLVRCPATVEVHFRQENITTQAEPGDYLTEVAEKAGVTIPTGCWQGNCGICEVECFKFNGDPQHDAEAAHSPAVVRACVTKLPPGYSRLEIAAMEDAMWGLDGFDT